MFGYDKTYAELLEESGLKTLRERRENAITRFAQKCSTNPVYSRWFKENLNRQSGRNPKRFEEKLARTNRLYKSPLFTIRRALNSTTDLEPPGETGSIAYDLPLNDPFLT